MAQPGLPLQLHLETVTKAGACQRYHLRIRIARTACAAFALGVCLNVAAQTGPPAADDAGQARQKVAAQTVTVFGREADLLSPDPATSAFAAEELLAANPGRPGVPFSVPGFPVDTASGGIKAPQYFAPGVAGDHGGPVAQYFQVGDFLFPNNLTANAHGNGYADPNLVIAGVLSGVQVDSGAFNARYGDHSVNLAVDYLVRASVAPFVELSSDGRDGTLAAGWSPARTGAWLALEASLGNGFLARPEERQQYKLNGLRAWTLGRHQLTVFGAAYYGFSRVPGLIPLNTPVTNDTIDPHQKDLTHTTLAVLTDSWRPAPGRVLTLSGYTRTYSLALDSNFGSGLIEESELRTIQGGNATYTQQLGPRFIALAGLDYRRDAPRNLDLARADERGDLQLVTSNDLSITDYGSFAGLQAQLGHTLELYLALRHDTVRFASNDRLAAENSYAAATGTTGPKATLTWGLEDAGLLPRLSFSFGRAFHANDPRIGSAAAQGPVTAHGSLITQSRQYQLVAEKRVAGTELRLTLGHQTNTQELAGIDPDTGLQQDTGPSLNRYFTVSAQRRYARGLVQASYSQADARDRLLGQPVPEAPRLIVDASATIERLPYRTGAKAEYEYVGEKPLGNGFHGRPVQEIRGCITKSLDDGRWLLSANGELAGGASGQSLETFALPGEPTPFERVVGVPLRSTVSLALRYQFR
jgi:hypothetical protein